MLINVQIIEMYYFIDRLQCLCWRHVVMISNDSSVLVWNCSTNSCSNLIVFYFVNDCDVSPKNGIGGINMQIIISLLIACSVIHFVPWTFPLLWTFRPVLPNVNQQPRRSWNQTKTCKFSRADVCPGGAGWTSKSNWTSDRWSLHNIVDTFSISHWCLREIANVKHENRSQSIRIIRQTSAHRIEFNEMISTSW